MIFQKKLSLCALLAINLLAAPLALADDGGNNDDGANNNNNDDGAAAADDDAYQKYFANNGVKNWDGFGAGNDNIKYWTDYAIYPDRCIVR